MHCIIIVVCLGLRLFFGFAGVIMAFVKLCLFFFFSFSALLSVTESALVSTCREYWDASCTWKYHLGWDFRFRELYVGLMDAMGLKRTHPYGFVGLMWNRNQNTFLPCLNLSGVMNFIKRETGIVDLCCYL